MLQGGEARPGHLSDWVPCKDTACVERTGSPAQPVTQKQQLLTTLSAEKTEPNDSRTLSSAPALPPVRMDVGLSWR